MCVWGMCLCLCVHSALLGSQRIRFEVGFLFIKGTTLDGNRVREVILSFRYNADASLCRLTELIILSCQLYDLIIISY